ncbi:hypothetical protein M0805_006199 [Coniferiporia weirii]|nr:hypothetical protein M0805_006199 [Coniferiporia weirii]
MAPAVLDSSPAPIDGSVRASSPKRSLKRSASTASLLTPPRTINRAGKKAGRRTKSRSRVSERETDHEATDSDTEIGTGGGRRLDFGHKKRRLGDLDERLEALIESIDGEDSENPFWVGPSKTAEPADEERKGERARSASPPLVHFRGKAPVSPPPSHRQKPAVADVVDVVEQPPLPSTPKGKQRKEYSPVRDSPNNPFLDDDSPVSIAGDPVEPRTPTAQAEKPTIAYVFRGVRATFANPMFNLPPDVHERSLLPVEHPDYSPDPACPPKLLFADARKRRAPSSPTRVGKSKSAERSTAAIPSNHTDDEWNDSDDEDDLHVTPPKRLFV